MVRWFLGFKASCNFSCNFFNPGYRYNQKCSLVNVKLKWVKDSVLDTVVTGGRELRAAWVIVSLIAADPGGCLPVYRFSGRRRGQLGLPYNLKVSAFLRKYPNIFDEFHVPDSGGTLVPWFGLTPSAVKIQQEEATHFRQNERDFLDRLCKLLMLTKDRALPLQTIDQLKWDLGLPHDYVDSFVPNYDNVFSLIRLPDDRVALKLEVWNDELAVSQLERNAALQQRKEDVEAGRLAFPIGFTRGFGLKRKSIEWLEEWQRLPYTSPYSDSAHLDSRTDVSEKRIVGVFHELLHLSVQKKTERRNVSNLRKQLALPQKFTKVFERHPGIFYISKKGDTQTVVLREAYDGHQLIYKHPIADIRERFMCLMKQGFLDRTKGLLYKKDSDASLDKERVELPQNLKAEFDDSGFESGKDSYIS